MSGVNQSVVARPASAQASNRVKTNSLQRGESVGPGRADDHSLVTQVKLELNARFSRGERPTVAEYLDRHPELMGASERVLSLLYEEFCLLEEAGENPDPEEFCQGYELWRDSLISQLKYHAAFSQLVVNPRPKIRLPEPGERFHTFVLESKLGEGGCGRVYLARDQKLGDKRVALKISPDRGDEPAIQGRLDHPHIVAVNHVERDPESGLRGLCMPYWPGLSLDQVIRKIDPAKTSPRTARVLWDSLADCDQVAREPSSVRADEPHWPDFPKRGTFADGAVWLILKVAEGLAHAHSRDILHRDIKPANILLTRRGGPLLLDFNLSQAPDQAEDAEISARGGTLPYMAPEHLEAFLDPSTWERLRPSTDLFSLGLVLRELVTGETPAPPSKRSSLPRMVNALLIERRESTPVPVRRPHRPVPHAIDAILARCLCPDIEQRYQSAQELIEDLRAFLDRRPLVHAENRSRREALGNSLSRHRRGILLVSGSCATILLGTLIYFWGSSIDPAYSAEKLFQQADAIVTQRDPSDEELKHAVSLLNRAADRYERAARAKPDNPEHLVQLGHVHDQLGYILRDLREAQSKILAHAEQSLNYYQRAMNLVEQSSRHPDISFSMTLISALNKTGTLKIESIARDKIDTDKLSIKYQSNFNEIESLFKRAEAAIERLRSRSKLSKAEQLTLSYQAVKCSVGISSLEIGRNRLHRAHNVLDEAISCSAELEKELEESHDPIATTLLEDLRIVERVMNSRHSQLKDVSDCTHVFNPNSTCISNRVIVSHE